MQMTEGHLLAWAATAQVLEQIDPDELDLLPDIAASTHAPVDRISRVPGAFEFDPAQLQSMAGAVFAIVALGLGKVAPKLFEAALDVGKDAVKKVVEQRIKNKASPTVETHAPPSVGAAPPGIDMARLRETIRVAVLERRLSPGTADVIANAVITQLSISVKS